MKEIFSQILSNLFLKVIILIITLLSGFITIFQKWDYFYYAILLKKLNIPVFVVFFIIISLFFLLLHFYDNKINIDVNKLKKIEGKRFGVQQVILDGKNFERCQFHGTELIFNGKKSFILKTNEFINCKFTFSQNAALTLQVMTKFYQDEGMRDLIIKTIENIKQGEHPESTPLGRIYI